MSADAALLFVESFGIGLAVAAPVGPMALLCISRSLHFGPGNGLLFGSGIAAADATYAAIAAAGLTAVSALLLGMTPWIKGLGGLLLLWLGLRTALARAPDRSRPPAAGSRLRAFVTAYGLTITNPPTILYFASIFASLGGIAASSAAPLFPLGVFAGSLAWWLLLVTAVRRSQHWLTAPVMRWINRVSGMVLLGFALTALWSVAAGVFGSGNP